MRTFMIAVGLTMALAGAGTAQLPAQKGVAGKGDRPVDPPTGKSAVTEPSKTACLKLKPKGGGNPKAVAAIADADFLIGIRGYADGDGIVVLSIVQRKDLDQNGKIRCPAAEIAVDFRGNGKTVKVRLEGGDKITSVDGFETTTLDELVVAVNSASDPHALAITFIDWRTGNEYSGTINAMKVK